MYVANLDGLSYAIYSVGKTKDECRQNMVRAFSEYVKFFQSNVEQWIEDIGENLNDYNNDIWTFLHDYYGVHMFDITKGYALGWE